jgi:hypothetical protein
MSSASDSISALNVRTLSSPAPLSTSSQTLTSYATRSEDVCQSCTSSDAYNRSDDMIQGFLVYFPVPVNEIICGLFPALSVTTSEAVLFPLALGVNATLTAHDLLIKLSALIQKVFVMLNSPAFTPVSYASTLALTVAAANNDAFCQSRRLRFVRMEGKVPIHLRP